MSDLKIFDWIDPDEDERITIADIQTASREAAERVEELEAENERLQEALSSIAANTCCEPCQEAKRVAQAALAGGEV